MNNKIEMNFGTLLAIIAFFSTFGWFLGNSKQHFKLTDESIAFYESPAGFQIIGIEDEYFRKVTGVGPDVIATAILDKETKSVTGMIWSRTNFNSIGKTEVRGDLTRIIPTEGIGDMSPDSQDKAYKQWMTVSRFLGKKAVVAVNREQIPIYAP